MVKRQYSFNILSRYYKLPIELRAAFWFLICSLLQSGISVLTTPIFTRLLTTAEYGQYSVYQSWYGIITIVVSLRLSSGMYMQGLIKFDEEREVYSTSMQGLTLSLCMAWIIVYIVCPDFWNSITKLTEPQMIAMLASIWASATFGFWAVEQRVNYRYHSLVTVTLLIAVLSPIASIVLVLNMKDKVTARILGSLIVNLICSIWVFIGQMKRGHGFFHRYFWRYALSFNLPLIPHYISQNILNSADRIMIKDLTSASDAGIYSIAYSISMLMMLFNSAIIQTIDPWIYQRIKEKRISEIKNVAYPALMFIAGVNLLLIAFAPEAIKIFAPPAYHDAIWVIPPVAMSVIFIFSYDLFVKFEFYFEKPKFIMFTSIAVASVNVVLNYIFIQLFSYKAAAYTTLICYILYALGHYQMMQRICNESFNGEKPYSLKTLMRIYATFIIGGFIFLSVYRYLIVRYLLILGGLILIMLFRERIISMVKMFISIKKKKA